MLLACLLAGGAMKYDRAVITALLQQQWRRRRRRFFFRNSSRQPNERVTTRDPPLYVSCCFALVDRCNSFLGESR